MAEPLPTRSEIVRRDHRIALLERALRNLGREAGENSISAVDRESAEYGRRLEEDLAFLRRWNQGTDYMGEEPRRRALEIAGMYDWVDAGQQHQSIISRDEIEYLRIPSGSLSAEERDIINKHAFSTIKMLEALPYPKNLRNVPRIAGSHHERMDGRGYPLGLTRDQIPIQGRMIGIADVFEALTACDRPYKPAKSLSQAMEILGEMSREGHIDTDLYELFRSEELHLKYAEEYLAQAVHNAS